MPEGHALLSPSSSGRWLTCTASVKATEDMDSHSSSIWAQEGTNAHTLAELKARRRLLGSPTGSAYQSAYLAFIEQAGYVEGSDQVLEMQRHTTAYVSFLEEQMGHDGTLWLERRVDTGVPSCWGTADAIIVRGDTLYVTDLKYGSGHRVDAEGNSQLMLYGLGALDLVDMLHEVKYVVLSIFQPRMDNISSVTMTADELRAWRDDVARPAATAAVEGTGTFVPSEHCRWCPLAGQCPAQVKQAAEAAFGPAPSVLSAVELAEALRIVPVVRDWANAVERVALDQAYSQGVQLPGWKVVMKGGRRSITDAAGAIQTLIDHGYQAEEVAELRVQTLGHLEKLLGGRAEFDKLLSPYVATSPPKPALVSEDDDGDVVSPNTEAQRVFR